MSYDTRIDGFRLSNIDAMADDEWIDCMNSFEPNLLEVNLRFRIPISEQMTRFYFAVVGRVAF